MTEPTIQELIQLINDRDGQTDEDLIRELINQTKKFACAEPCSDEEIEAQDKQLAARSALLSRITQIQQEAESAKTDYDLLSDDYNQLGISLEKAKQESDEWKASYTRALKDSDALYASKTAAQEEAEEWHKMADTLICWVDTRDGERVLSAIEDYNTLSLRYPHASNEKGTEGKE
jgi:seryl-tRNA synthetase